MQPKDGIECRDRNLGHMAPISAGPVVNVVVDEFDVDISLDSGILADGHCRKLRIAQRISQESINHFGRGSVYFIVDGVLCGHELGYLLIVDHPVNPRPTVGHGLGLIGTAAGSDTIAILEYFMSKESIHTQIYIEEKFHASCVCGHTASTVSSPMTLTSPTPSDAMFLELGIANW